MQQVEDGTVRAFMAVPSKNEKKKSIHGSFYNSFQAMKIRCKLRIKVVLKPF